MHALSAVALTLALTVTGAHAQTAASWGTYGASCSTPVQTRPSSITNSGLPVLGQTFSVVYRGDAFASTATLYPVLLVSGGPASIPVGSSVLPLPQQPSNCFLLVDPAQLAVVLPAVFDPATGTFQTDFPFAIPNVPSLANLSVFFQFVMTYTQCGIVPPCTLEAIGTTEGGQATLGV